MPSDVQDKLGLPACPKPTHSYSAPSDSTNEANSAPVIICGFVLFSIPKFGEQDNKILNFLAGVVDKQIDNIAEGYQDGIKLALLNNGLGIIVIADYIMKIPGVIDGIKSVIGEIGSYINDPRAYIKDSFDGFINEIKSMDAYEWGIATSDVVVTATIALAGGGLKKAGMMKAASKGGDVVQDALQTLNKSGLRPGQTEISRSRIMELVESFDTGKATSSVFKSADGRFLVEGHHTTVAGTILGKSGANMGLRDLREPAAMNVFWTKNWWEFGKTAIKVKP